MLKLPQGAEALTPARRGGFFAPEDAVKAAAGHCRGKDTQAPSLIGIKAVLRQGLFFC